MTSRRQVQLAELLRDEISEILQREMKDPRLGLATVTHVKLSPDLRYATVYVSVFGTPEEQSENLAALQGAAGFVRRLLRPRLRVRHIPEVTFKLDRSMQHAEEIQRTLYELRPQLYPESDTATSPGQEEDKNDES